MDERETTAVIDRTLAGDPIATGYPLERELQELTLALSAEAPEPDAAFAEQLDERVVLGFPRDGRRARLAFARARLAAGARRLGTRNAQLAGAAASVAIVLAVAVSLAGDDASQHADVRTVDRPAAGAAGGASADAVIAPERHRSQRRLGAAPAATAIREQRLAPPTVTRNFLRTSAPGGTSVMPRPGFAPGQSERRIERSASLTLAAPVDRLDRVADRIDAVTQSHRGFVLESSLATGRGGATTGGHFELRIPAARLRPALGDLAKLGQVRARTQAGEDVTATFVTVGDRLEAARAERRGLLTRLEAASTDNEATSLRLQLDANAREVNRHQARLRSMRVRTNYANVSVTLEPRDGEGAAAPGDGLGGALDDALATLGDSLELAIRALGVAIPLALLALAAALAARAFQRRRREAALS